MSLIVTADWHLSDQARDFYRHDTIAAIPDIIKQKRASGCLVLGDLTEEKDRHSAWLANKVVEHLEAIGKPTLVLYGNHDGVSGLLAFFEFIGKIPGLTWVKNVTDARDLPSPWPELLGKCLLLPHTRDYEKDWFGIDFSAYPLILAHNTFAGSDVGHGRKMDGIPTSVFPKTSRVLSGDIHVPQSIGPVTYVGAPYHVDFGDDYHARLILLEHEKRLVSVKSIALGDRPQKRLVTLDGPQDLKRRCNANRGDILKVRVRLDDYADWPEVKKQVLDWGGKYGYVVHSTVPILSKKKTKTNHTHAQQTARSDKEVLEEFSERHGLDARTTKVGTRILES